MSSEHTTTTPAKAPLSRGKALLHELRGLSRNPAMVALVVVILLFSMTAVAFLDANNPGATKAYSSAYYYSNGSYYFEFYAYNQFGHGLGGISFSMVVGNISNGALASREGSTSAEGFLSFSVALPEGNYLFSGIAGSSTNPFFWTNSPTSFSVTTTPTVPPDQIEGLGVPLAGRVDISKDLTQVPALLVFFPLPGLSPQSPVSVYYKVVNLINGLGGPLPEGSMIRLGEATSPVSLFPLIIQPTENGSELNVQVEVFSSQGTLLWTDTNQAVLSFYPIITQSSVDGAFDSFASGSFIPAIGILSTFVAFLIFGRERASGAMQSVVVRPVTREGLVLSRFLGSLLLLLAGVLAGLFLADALGRGTTGFYVSGTTLAETFVGAVVVSGFFLGLTMAVTQATRRSGPVLLLGVGLFAFFDFFWGSITSGVASILGLAPGVSGYDRFLVNVTFFNPFGFAQLVQMYFSGTIASLDPTSAHSAAYYGIGLPALAIAAVVWIVPLVLVATLLARKADY